MHVRRDVPISRFHTSLAELPQRKVLAEFYLLVNTYFCHNSYSFLLFTLHFSLSQMLRRYGVTALRRQRMTLPVFLNTDLVVPFSTKSPAFSMK